MSRVWRVRRTFCTNLLALSLSIFAIVGETDAASGDPSGPVVLVLGDSISAEYGLKRGEGWVKLLELRLAESAAGNQASKPASPWQIVNASISGETTAGGRSRIAKLLTQHQPAVLLLELGANDALRGLDLGSTERNLQEISKMARKQGAVVVVLGMQVPPNYGRAYTERFANIFKTVAADNDGELVPFLLSDIVGQEGAFQADRIHPSAQVQATMLETAWPAISRALERASATR